MKDTNNMGKGEFENTWKQAFEGSEIEPSENLWVGIESAIANEEAARYRQGMTYYKWIAAAILLLALSVGGYLGYMYQSTDAMEDSITQAEQAEIINAPGNEQQSLQVEPDDLVSKEEGKKVAGSTQIAKTTGPSQELSDSEIPDQSSTSNSQGSILIGASEIENQDHITKMQNSATARSGLSPFVTSREFIIASEISAPSLPEKVYGVPVYPVIRKKQESNLWAGISVMPGYFNPNYQGQNNLQANYSSLRSIAQTSSAGEEHATGLSMSFGVDMGVKLADRWQISSGLQYLNNQVQSSTDLVLNNRTPVFSSVIESLDLSESSSDITYEPTDLNNTFQFISIPVQAGYMVFDSKVKLMVQAGFASDFFIKNEISAEDQSLESVTINSGSDAPFRSVYFNGLIGAQASYQILPRYLVTLEPRYKLALSDFTKPESGYSSIPSSFGVGVGIRYVFK